MGRHKSETIHRHTDTPRPPLIIFDFYVYDTPYGHVQAPIKYTTIYINMYIVKFDILFISLEISDATIR